LIHAGSYKQAKQATDSLKALQKPGFVLPVRGVLRISRCLHRVSSENNPM
jgi:hypothetical protein